MTSAEFARWIGYERYKAERHKQARAKAKAQREVQRQL